MEKKERTEAQKAADKRYREKNPDRDRALSFRFKTAEADRIDLIIRQSGMTKADFLRRAVVLFEEGKF